MDETQKITAHLPRALLVQAQKATGRGITETLRMGLSMVAAAQAAEDLRRLRGKVKLAVNLEELRRDR